MSELRNAYALVVGISRYTSLKELRSAQPGAEDIAKAFKQLGYEVETLFDEDATTGHLDDKIEWLFEDRRPTDALVFYFAGHGYPVGDDVFLATSDFSLKRAQRNRRSGFPLSELRKDYFQKTSAQDVMLILDCCYSGGFQMLSLIELMRSA